MDARTAWRAVAVQTISILFIIAFIRNPNSHESLQPHRLCPNSLSRAISPLTRRPLWTSRICSLNQKLPKLRITRRTQALGSQQRTGDLMKFEGFNSTWRQSIGEVEIRIQTRDIPASSINVNQINRRELEISIEDTSFKINDLWQNVVADETFWSIEEQKVEGNEEKGRGMIKDVIQGIRNQDEEDFKLEGLDPDTIDLDESVYSKINVEDDDFDISSLEDVTDDQLREEGARADILAAAEEAGRTGAFKKITRPRREPIETVQKPFVETINVLSITLQKETSGLNWKSLQLCAEKLPDRNVTASVYFDVVRESGLENIPLGRIVIGLFGNAVPKAAENFRCLSTGERRGAGGKPLHYLGSEFFSIVPQIALLGGDIEFNNGTGGESIYGENFEDEFYDKHNEKYLVSMSNRGRSDDNRSQFFILLRPDSWLNEKHVVVGKVLKGFDVVDRIEALGDKIGVPTCTVKISRCGEYFEGQTESMEEDVGFLGEFDSKLQQIKKDSVLFGFRNKTGDEDLESDIITSVSNSTEGIFEELRSLRSETYGADLYENDEELPRGPTPDVGTPPKNRRRYPSMSFEDQKPPRKGEPPEAVE